MANGKYRVVFRGELTGEQPIETVQQRIASQFRMPEERVEALFSGKPVVIKQNADEATVRKLERAFHQAGAVCEVQADDAPQTLPTSEPAAGGAVSDAHNTTETPSAPSAQAPAPAAAPTATAGSTAAAGDPNQTVVALDVPDSFGDMAVDESETPLAERKPSNAPQIDLDGIELAAADADVGGDRERPQPAEIDTSGLQMEPLEDN